MIFNETAKELSLQLSSIVDELESDGEKIPTHVGLAVTLNHFDMSVIEIFPMADVLLEYGMEDKFRVVKCKDGWSLN